MVVIDPSLTKLSDGDRRLLESWLVEFDRSWDEGRLAALVPRLPPPGSSLRLLALVGMVKIDLARHWQRGRRVSVESYLQDYPELGTPDTVASDLIHAEYEARRQLGETAELADFARRFPRQADELQQLVEQGAKETAAPRSALLSTLEPGPASPLADTPWLASEPSSLPEVFGRYRILKKLGRGGMGSVYLAHDSQLDRQVALKVPHFTPDDDPAILERFYREAKAAAAFRHPNLCPVYDVGAIDGTHYLTMAYIDGQPLSERIKGGGPTPPPQAAAVVRQLALALAQAHAHGVLHRDLKPSNVMITREGEPVIMDFGLARRFTKESVRLTQEGALLGTPAYMSPEQVTGDVEGVGPGCDIYSLGVILYELLTGRLPFQGSWTAVLVQILNEPPERPSAHRPDLDPRLEAICLKAMAKKVEDRYASMGELAQALADYLQAPPQPAVAPAAGADPVPRPVPRRPFRSRKPWVALAAGAAAVVLLAGVVLYVATDQGTIRIEVNDQNAIVRVDGEVIRVEKLGEPITLRPGKHSLEVRRGDAVAETREFTVRRGDNPVLQITLLPPKRPEPVPPAGSQPAFQPFFNGKNLDGWEGLRAYWRVTDDGTLVGSSFPDGIDFNTFLCSRQKYKDFELKFQVRLKGGKGNSGVQIRSEIVDRQRFTVKGPQADIGEAHWGSLWGELSGKQMKAAPPDQVAGVLREDDFNDYYVKCVGKHVTIRLNGATTVDEDFADLPAEGIIAWQIHSGGPMEVTFKNIAFTDLSHPEAARGELGRAPAAHPVVQPAPGGGVDPKEIRRQLGRKTLDPELATLEGHKGPVGNVVFSPDGKLLASASDDGTVRLWDVATGKERAVLKGHRAAVGGLAFAPDGKTLASTSRDGTARLWDVAKGEERAVFRDKDYVLGPVVFAPDGASLATGSGGGGVAIWDAATGTGRAACKGHSQLVNSLAYSPDGKTLASGSADGTVRLWDAATGKRLATWPGHDRGWLARPRAEALQFTPDGKTLAAADQGHVRLWDLAKGEQFASLPGARGGACQKSMTISADGKRMAAGGGWGGAGILVVWDTASWKECARTSAHGNLIESLAFSPDGKVLATTGDVAVKLWDVSGVSARELANLQEHSRYVNRVVFSPDGRLLASASNDGTVKLWDVAAAVKQQAGR